MTKKKKNNSDDLYNKYKIDKDKFDELFNSDNSYESTKKFLSELTVDVFDKLSLDTAHKTTLRTNKDLQALKKQYKKKAPKKSTPTQTTPTKNASKKQSLQPKVDSTMTTAKKTKTPSKTNVRTSKAPARKDPPPKTVKDKIKTPSAPKSTKTTLPNSKTFFTSIVSSIKNKLTKPTEVSKKPSPKIQKKTSEDAIKRMKERESKITDLLNKDKGKLT